MTARTFFRQYGLGSALAAMLIASAPTLQGAEAPVHHPSTPARDTETLNSTRSFLMGFTPFHFSWIEDRIAETYGMIHNHSDLIAYHFDEGVPWNEASSNSPYHPNVEKELLHRKQRLRSGDKVYVATTPINFSRDGLADYWGKKAQIARTGEWKGKQLDDPEVIRTYINYCEKLIETFNPDYFVYGIEVNLLAENNPEAFRQFETLAASVYPALKRSHPDLPIALSFYLLKPERLEEARKQATRLLPFTDIFAVSTYPYMALNDDGYAAEDIPEDWLKQVKSIAPGKPYAIAETGYIAEDLKVFTKTMPGSADAQNHYVERLLHEANELNAEFVVWFIVADYDELWSVLKWTVLFNPLIRAWKDTGLHDGELNPRPALKTWDSWLARPIRE